MPSYRATMSYKMHSFCLKCSLVAVLLLFFQVSHAQIDTASISQTINAQNGNKEPLAVLIGTCDSVLYERYENGMKDRTKFAIGESSQWLTAAMILTLADQGKLALDDKVKKYIPLFGSYGKSYITIRECLAHMTGIRVDKKSGLLKKKQPMSLEEAAERLAKSDIENNPGEFFHYSDAGYVIVARIAEIVTRRRFDMLIRTQLLVPLGMRYTSFSTFDGSAPDPLAGGTSTAEDYLHFLQMLLNRGQYNGKQVLSEKSVDYLFTIQTIPEKVQFAPPGAKGLDYASGSWVIEAKDHKAIVMGAPAFSGPYPVIDRCRNIALLLFREAKDEPEASLPDLGEKLRQEIDKAIPESCNW